MKMRHYLKTIATVLVTAGVFAMPAAAQEPIEEPNGYAITDVNLRAGPSTDYPVLVTVPEDAPINILGCLEDYSWCDTVFEGYRGWMSAIYLAGLYDGDYFLLRDYAPDLGYQQVTFEIDAYWDAYYQDEPFYAERARWTDPAPEGPGYVDEAVFYDKLEPHGSWTWTQGRYVWVPTGVDRGWRPYTRGRWVYTNRGWTWVSDEPFGWATYHYGRWGFSNRIGWFWVPGTRWAPAWVSWRQSPDYLAWAPLPPTYDRGPGISINISIGSVPDYYWSVVPSRRFLSPNLGRYYVNDYRRRRPALQRTRYVGNTRIVNNTTIVNNVVNVNYVQQQTNQQVVTRRIVNTGTALNGNGVQANALQVYRPRQQRGRRGRLGPAAPQQLDQVAALSPTAAQAEGAAATDDLLAPPDVRDAVKRRKNGKKRKAWNEGAPKVSPAAKRANARPVPAQGLGPSKAALDKADGRKGHAGKKGKKPKQANVDDVQNGVSPGKRRKDAQPGLNASRGLAPAGQPVDIEPDGPQQKSLGAPDLKPEHKANPNKKKKTPAQAKRKEPNGKKKASSKNGKPKAKNARAKDKPEAKPDEPKSPAQATAPDADGKKKKKASSNGNKPKANNAQSKDEPKAKANEQKSPAQAKGKKPGANGKKKASSKNGKPKAAVNKKPKPKAVERTKPEPKAAVNDEAKPKAAAKKKPKPEAAAKTKPKPKAAEKKKPKAAANKKPKPEAAAKKKPKSKTAAKKKPKPKAAANKKPKPKAAANKRPKPKAKTAAKKKPSKKKSAARRNTPKPAALGTPAKRQAAAKKAKPKPKAKAKAAAKKKPSKKRVAGKGDKKKKKN